MNSDWIERELENCLTELRSICDHLEPPLGHWQKLLGAIEWWWRNDVGETLFVFVVWIGLFVGVPLVCSMCESKKSAEVRSPHRDVVTQYVVTYGQDSEQDEEEVDDE